MIVCFQFYYFSFLYLYHFLLQSILQTKETLFKSKSLLISFILCFFLCLSTIIITKKKNFSLYNLMIFFFKKKTNMGKNVLFFTLFLFVNLVNWINREFILKDWKSGTEILKFVIIYEWKRNTGYFKYGMLKIKR